jgi:hypothetical protein
MPKVRMKPARPVRRKPKPAAKSKAAAKRKLAIQSDS